MEVERSQYADEQLQALLHRLRKEDPNIACPQGKKVTKICLNQKCANALRCSDARCQSCGKDVHVGCIGNCTIQEITEMVNERTEGCRQILAKILRLEEEFIDNIRKTRKQFVEKYLSGAGVGAGAELVEKIYGEKRYNALTGKQANKMCRDLQEAVVRQVKADKEMVDQYANGLGKKLGELQEMRKDVGKGKSNGWVGQNNLISKLTEQQIRFIADSLNQPKKLQLLFRASEHQFKAAAFHQHCDGIENTFVIARTNFGRTIAGFTRRKWDSVSENVNGESKDAFLLQVDLMQKMVHQKERLICCSANYGPIFGDGSDFLICNNCNTSNNCAYFPYSFNVEGPNKYTECEETYRAFTGAADHQNFRVVEYEVFAVTF